MPSYMPSTYFPAEPSYLSSHLHSNDDLAVEYARTYPSLSAMYPSDADLDPYNHGKHASYAPFQSNFQDHRAVKGDFGCYIAAPTAMPLPGGNVSFSSRDGSKTRHQYESSTAREPQAQDEKAVGGVSAQLDYRMEQICDFVVEMSIELARPPTCDRVMFRKWVLQVLNATRLPSATIVLSLSYLSIRVAGMSAAQAYFPNERGMYEMLTVALILGSKFLDDNTFQNKSWAEVSNIPVRALNRDEMEWLGAFEHRLHMPTDIPNGFAMWQLKWTAWRSRRNLPLATLPRTDFGKDVSAKRPRSSRVDSSPMRHAPGYFAPAMSANKFEQGPEYVSTYSPYQDWHARRPLIQSSPSASTLSGPNTPDYYTNQHAWTSTHLGSARDVRFGNTGMSQYAHDMSLYPSAHDIAVYNQAAPSMWNLHGVECSCGSCRHAQLLQPRYGPLVSA